jgi:hypothetical protein
LLSNEKKDEVEKTEEKETTSIETEETDETEETPTEEKPTEEEVTIEAKAEDEEETKEEIETKDVSDEPEEAIEAEVVEEDEEIKLEEEAEDLAELDIPEEPIEIVAEEVEVAIEPEIPEIPIEIKADELEEDEELEPDEDELEVKVEEDEPEKVKKPVKKKKTYFGLSLLIGITIALAIEVLFSIPLWLQGSSRPDLYYIELVLILIALMIPGLITRSLQRGIFGAFIIFIISFAVPTVLAIFQVQTISNPLAPLFASTDFALPTLDIFIDLFPTLEDLPFAQLQRWIWIIDLIIMFILTVVVVVIATALIRNVTKRKKKAGNWVAIPFLSIGLIIFAIFTPIIFSSTSGVIQAGTSFLAGSAKMQEAYGTFENSSLSLDLDFVSVNNSLGDASYWFEISQANYQGLRNIGFIELASIAAGQYGDLIRAGDQLALATFAMTSVLYPLFSGIWELTQSLKNATDDMANFGETSLMPSDTDPFNFLSRAITDINELKASLLEAIATMESAKETLLDVEEKINEADIAGAFNDVKNTLGNLTTENFPDAVAGIVEEIKDKLGSFDDQLTGFADFISFTNTNIDPTINILWMAYNSIEGNEYMKDYRFTAAKQSFNQALGNLSEALTFTAYTPPGGLSGVFSIDITDDFSLLLEDLLIMLDPLLKEELAYATTYEAIWEIVSIMNTSPLDQELTYLTVTPIIDAANESARFTLDNGTIAQAELLAFRGNDYGSFDSIADNFDSLLTGDFSPLEFGQVTFDMSTVYSGFVESMKQKYYLLNDAEAITFITISDTTMDSILLLVPVDIAHAVDYFTSWKDAMASIRSVLVTAIGDIPTEINGLLTDIQEK